jgi:hypothetical protein
VGALGDPTKNICVIILTDVRDGMVMTPPGWIDMANSLNRTEVAGRVVILKIGDHLADIAAAANPQQVTLKLIYKFVVKNDCATLYILGHRGYPSNEGGVAIYTSPDDSPHDDSADNDPGKVYILRGGTGAKDPVTMAFLTRLRDFMKRKHYSCGAINIVACAEQENEALQETARGMRKRYADGSGCTVCISTRTVNYGPDSELATDKPLVDTLGPPILGGPTGKTELQRRWPFDFADPDNPIGLGTATINEYPRR